MRGEVEYSPARNAGEKLYQPWTVVRLFVLMLPERLSLQTTKVRESF